MNVLLLFPKFPAETFSNSARSLRRFSRYRVGMPPLGLLTLASYMPADFHLRLIDRNLAEETAADWPCPGLVSSVRGPHRSPAVTRTRFLEVDAS